METLSLALDIAVGVLLVVTILYAFRLNRQLNTLRRGNTELQTLVAALGEASERAEAGVRGMRRAAQENGEALQKAIERAQTLRDELSFMIESGDAVANRIEGALAHNGSGPSEAGKMDAPIDPLRRRAAPSLGGDAGPGGRAVPRAREPFAQSGRPSAGEGAGLGQRTRATRPDGQRVAPGAAASSARRVGLSQGGADADGRDGGSASGTLSGVALAAVEAARAAAQQGAGNPAPQRSGASEDSRNEGKKPTEDRSGLSRAERELLEALEGQR